MLAIDRCNNWASMCLDGKIRNITKAIIAHVLFTVVSGVSRGKLIAGMETVTNIAQLNCG